MKFISLAGILVGGFIAFLGLLWFLQGTGILHLRPIMCVANCEEIVSTSPTWAIAGAVAFIIGSVIAVMSVRRFRKPREKTDETAKIAP